jgi:hypothetical protein
MRAFVRFLVFLLVLAVLVSGVAWFWAGRSAGPTITIRQPGKFVGQNSSLELLAEAPEGKFTAIDVTVEQSASRSGLHVGLWGTCGRSLRSGYT